MLQTVYYVDKRTGTSADALLAAGAAKLLREILLNAGKPTDSMRLVDSGPCYRIEVPVAVEEADIEQIEHLALLQHLDTETQKQALGSHYGLGFPYDEQRVIRDAYREKRKQLPPEARNPDARLFGHPALDQLAQSIPPPDTLLPLYLVINQMKVAPSFNDPVLRWRELANTPPVLRAHLRLLLELFSTYPNPLDATIARWRMLAQAHGLGDPEMTMLQVINPTTGKGANSRKANALTIGGQKEFWLLELLKFAGFFVLAHPQTISNTKDRKTYVLRPRSIRFSLLDELMRRFRDVLWSSTPVKLDILAVLQFTRVLINHDLQALKRESGAPRTARKPTDRVHGFDVTFYKDMGSAFAVMNVAALNLPEWLPTPTTAQEAERALAVLKEHIDVISLIRARDGEERTAEHELLRRYRDFLSGRTIEPFLDFAALFAPYLSQKIERREPHKRFSIATLEELIAMTKHDFMPVIQSDGFQNIAAAIRRSTVSLQYAKGLGKTPTFDIRYGLAQELIRRSNYPDEFIAALSDFVARYNLETAQTFETSKGKIGRKRVTESDLSEIVELLAQGFSAGTIARLLVAFGSAKTSDDATEPTMPKADSLSSPLENEE